MAVAAELSERVGATSLLSGVPWASVPASLALSGERRLEARTFLTDGYGIRRRIEAVAGYTTQFGDLADVWMPPRLKGHVVREGAGLPFLSAGQVFESRPRVRKWIARSLVTDQDLRYVSEGWLLLTRSGEVGRTTAVYPHHLNKIITDDLLRVIPRSASDYGWLYAYMRTASFQAMARSSQYGHMIKHLEPEHVLALPVAMPDDATRRRIGRLASDALAKRVRALEVQERANEMYSALINPHAVGIVTDIVQSVPISEMASGRRRLEGQVARADVRQINALVNSAATHGVDTLGDVSESIMLGKRFKRYFGPNGKPYRSASELFDVNAPVTKRIYSALLNDPEPYMLHKGWLIMACSGQSYGLLGRTVVLTDRHEGVFGSHDLIRIIPNCARVRTGYLQTVLNHELYGRPLVVRHASGTSIPHLDPVDIKTVPVPRFDDSVEAEIADLCDEAIMLSDEADMEESEAISAAEQVIEDEVGVLEAEAGITTTSGD